MVNLRCANCGAETVPGTNFCRSCGAPVEPQPKAAEMPTALLEEKAAPRKTRRFEARTTAETAEARAVRSYRPAAPASTPQPAPAPPVRRSRLILALILLILLGGSAMVVIIKRTRHSGTQTQVSQQFVYPGAHTVVNVASEGGAVLQMETTDRLDKVSAWYDSTLKPTTTLQVTAATLIMKNDKITVTMAATDEGTSIVVKQVAP